MKYTLVSCHPYDRSFNAAMVKEIRDRITQNGSSVDDIDLTQLSFDPVLSPASLYEFSQARTSRGVQIENLDPVAVNLAQRVNGSDHLILVFPLWWELMPAQMKGFIDKVVFPKIFYTYRSEYSMQTVSPSLKAVTIITTMNTPKFLYRLAYGNCIRSALVKGTFQKLGIKKVRWVGYGQVKMAGPEGRKRILRGLARLF